MGHIFLSYSRKDKETAIRLAEKLEEKGYDVWIDLEDLPAGKRWRQKIVDAIQQADALVVVLSPNAVKSDGMRRESVLAEEEKKPIFPVKIQPATIPIDMRWTLAELQWIDLYTDFDAGFKQLLAALAEGRETPSPDAAPPGPPPPAAPDSKQGRLPWPPIVVGVGALAVIVIVLFVVMPSLKDGRPTPPPPAPETVAPSAEARSPTDTPTSTIVPTSTVLPTPTATPCAFEPQEEEIHEVWKDSKDQLDCPTAMALHPRMVEQLFENGRMFWREDTKDILVIFENKECAWEPNLDTWVRGEDPTYSCEVGVNNVPVEGFGKVWCALPEKKKMEIGRTGGVMKGPYETDWQDFKLGFVLRDNDGRYWIFNKNDGSCKGPQ